VRVNEEWGSGEKLPIFHGAVGKKVSRRHETAWVPCRCDRNRIGGDGFVSSGGIDMPGEHVASMLHSHETRICIDGMRYAHRRMPLKERCPGRSPVMIDITIRHGDAHDVDAIRTISAQPAVCKNTPQHPFPSFEKWQQRLERIREQGVSLVAEVDGAVVGYLAPHTEPNPRRRHAAGLGMMVDAAHHGRGIGSRLLAAAIDLAENWLNVTRIELTVFVDKPSGDRALRKARFSHRRQTPDYALRDGAYASVYRMARLGSRP
jgi:putative acetyltransferase